MSPASDPGADRPGPAHDAATITTPALLLLAGLAFVTELALFGGAGAVAYSVAGGGLVGWLAAAVAVLVVVGFWGLFMAPRARRRLGRSARVAVALLLCAGTAAGLLATGWTWWGGFVAVAGLAVVAAQTVLHGADGAATDR